MPSPSSSGHGAQLMSSRPGGELRPGAGAPLCLRGVDRRRAGGSGYAHRRAESFALPMRALGRTWSWTCTHLTRPAGHLRRCDLAQRQLYCPATPKALFELGPLARDASLALVETHDKMTASSLATARAHHEQRRGWIPPRQLSAVMASAAVRFAGTRRGSPSTGPRSSAPRTRLQSAVCKRASQCPRASTPRPRRSTTTPRRPTGALMHAGPLSSGRTRG